ncbi:MAG: hypothetical protein ACFB2W_11985, partial [Leptolyngbyaceae cyanobacterium]
PRRFVHPVLVVIEPIDRVHLISVCSRCSLVLRFTAVMNPENSSEVTGFMRKNGFTTQTLAIRYPIPTNHRSAG